MRYCANCGTQNSDEDRFCSQCGRPILARAPQAPPPAGTQPRPQAPPPPAGTQPRPQ
ncbi:MAG: zinc-ribbon domain-containing protein, partial [Clostridia bacterium]|nr:zinc-ribbon domain-containing protein [Clostridia bacterium]